MSDTQLSAIKGLTIRQVANVVGLKVRTIRHKLKKGEFPAPSYTAGKTYLWRAQKIEAWWEKQERKTRMGI